MEIDGRNLKIFSASAVDVAGEPGEILSSENELVIAAGNGALALAEVQLEGTADEREQVSARRADLAAPRPPSVRWDASFRARRES
jgi:methionyl-tRNA formyltransferase